MAEYRLEMSGVSKSFPGVKALDKINLKVRPGTVHALMGENGAGKSTLMKCLLITRVPGAESPGNTVFLLRVHRTRTTYFFDFHIAAVGEYLILVEADGFLPPVLLYVYPLLL